MNCPFPTNDQAIITSLSGCDTEYLKKHHIILQKFTDNLEKHTASKTMVIYKIMQCQIPEDRIFSHCHENVKSHVL
jgi:hypothetical protein